MQTNHQTAHALGLGALRVLPEPVGRRLKLRRAAPPADRRVPARIARIGGIPPAGLPMKLGGSTDADIAAPDLVYFPGRLTSDAGPEWHSDRVSSWDHSINGDRSGGERCTLASWDPEEFESDFDRLCDSTVAVCAIEDGHRRRFPLRDFG